jgi:NADPH-ferrihemoprotein reductase
MNTLKVLAQYAEDEKEKAELLALCAGSEESIQKYGSFITGDTRNFVDVLKSFPSCKPPLGHFLEIVPRLQPRFYSISSSPHDKESVLSISSVVVEYKTLTGRINKGVCSAYLATLTPTPDHKPAIEIFIRKSNFKLPPDPSTPIIMIGPGTGLAPFRGFIQERKYLANKVKKEDHSEEGTKNGKVEATKGPIGDTVLFFGCRHSEQDYLYRDELTTFVQDKIITSLFVAFSRESEKKVYVQDHLKEYADQFWHLMKTSYIYVCGDAKNMAKDVHKTLIELAIKKESMTEEQATTFINNINLAGRYLQDIWT